MKELTLVKAVSFLVLSMGVVIGLTLLSPAHNKNWTCTQQQAVNDILPTEYECIQFTKDLKNE